MPYGVGYVELEGQLRVEARLTVSDPAKLIIGMDMELVLDPLCIDEDGNQVVTYAFAPVTTLRRRPIMSSVAIVGIGMHEFGRNDGISGMDQGVVAVRRALADCGQQWSDMQFAVGGSMDGGAADTMVSRVGLDRPAVHQRRERVRDRRHRARPGREHDRVRGRRHRHGDRVRQARARRVPHPWPPWQGLVRRLGPRAHHAVLRHEDHPLHARVRHHRRPRSPRSPSKAFRNGSLNPMAWRRKPLSEQEVLDSLMLSYPLTQYMFCSPGEGGVAMILCRADKAKQYTDRPIYLQAAAVRTRKFGSFEVLAPSIALEHDPGPTSAASKAAFEMAGIGPEDIDVAQLQDTEAGAEIMHMAENGFCEHGEQEHMLANGETEINGRLPVNTDGGCLANGEPIGASGLRQVYENVLQLRGDAGERQVPNDPKVAYTHVYGAPGISGVTILSR